MRSDVDAFGYRDESTKAGENAALALGAGVIVPDDLPRLFKLRVSRQTNETPIDELVAAAGTNRLVWQLDKSDPQRRNLVAAALANVPYIERVSKALRPEELPPEAYDAIWPRVNRHLGTSATSIGSMVERSEEHTSELQSLMRNSYAVFCLNK